MQHSNKVRHIFTTISSPICFGHKENLVSITTLEDKGYKIAFMDGKVLAWIKTSTLKQVYTIGLRYECLYRFDTISSQALMIESIDSCDLWHKRLGHLNFQTLSSMDKFVVGFPHLYPRHGVCKGCALGQNIKSSFPSSESKTKRILEMVHSDLFWTHVYTIY